MHTRGRRGHGGVHVSLPFVTPHLWSIVAKFGQASGRLNLLTPLRPPPALVRKGTLWPEVGFTSASFYAQLGSVLQDACLPDATHADTKLATPGHKTRNPHVRMTHAAHWPTATKRTTDTCTPLFQRNPRSGALTCARIGPDHLNDSSSLSPVENGVLTPRPPTLRSSARRANGDLTIAAATVANGGTAVQFAHAKRDLLIQCVCPLC